MKIKHLQLLISALALISCGISRSEKKLSSEEIISKSIQFHDPHSHWSKFQATMNFESSFSWNDSIPEHLELTFDNFNNHFNYINHDRKVEIDFHPDSCKGIPQNELCNSYAWTYKFYPYVWGLPMKLKDPGIQPEKGIKKTALKNDSVWEIQVNYEAENFWFYFDDQNYQLRAFKFIKNDTSAHGEIVILDKLQEVQSINFPKHKTWLNLDSSLIGTNELIKN